MVERLVLDLHTDGRMSVTEWPAGEVSPASAGDAGWLRRPLDDTARESLRWYLEDYLRSPFGAYGERGPHIARQLPGWGARMFSALLGTGPARDAYLRARERGGPLEILLRSASAPLLALPWELMTDPDRPVPLALDGVVVTRCPAGADPVRTVAAAGGSRLRVLVVTTRPDGPADAGHTTVALPLLRRPGASADPVEISVLRPPTLTGLAEALRGAREEDRPFQVVHFDGPGVLPVPAGPGFEAGAAIEAAWPRAARLPRAARGDGPRGVLVLEQPGGGTEPVPVRRVARLLAATGVPLVVLHSGRSGDPAGEAGAAAAAQLLEEGAGAVLTLPHGLRAAAAAEFTAAFHERLLAGDPVALAVAAGRRRLAEQDLRSSPKGPLPLADWLVPVLHRRAEVTFPALPVRPLAPAGHPGPDSDGTLDLAAVPPGPPRAAGTPDGTEDLAPVGEFVGRDGLLLDLDAATRSHRVVVLHGAAGRGKTELAKAFGRWRLDTGAPDGPEAVIVHTSGPGTAAPGLAGVVDRIGHRLFAPEEFGPLAAAERLEAVEQALATRDLLLIWDDVDALAAPPGPAPDRAVPGSGADEEEERAALRAFLERLARRGRSAAVLTGRGHQDWLGPVPRRIEVSGLLPEEAAEYAGHLLDPGPDTVRKRGLRVFGELLEWLDGHPLRMRLVLSSLGVHEPWQALDTLVRSRAGTDDPPGARPAGPADSPDAAADTALAVGTAYALARLGEADRRALAAVTLFHGTVDATGLALLSRQPLLPERFRDRGTEDWQRLLGLAAGLGLLTPADGGTAFLVHPAIAARLTLRWRAEEPGYSEQHEAAAQALLGAQVNFCLLLTRELRDGSAAFALTALALQRRTIGALLGRAVDQGLWPQALALVRPLSAHWDAHGPDAEARAWTDRIRAAVEAPGDGPPDADTPAGALWLSVVGADARRLLRAGRTGEADHALQEVHRAVDGRQPDQEQLDDLADGYQQLGRLAVDRGDFAAAEEWYLHALALLERLGDADGIALGHHQLGVIAHRLGRTDDAERRTRQALDGFERLGESRPAAGCRHLLGVLAQEEGRFEEAYLSYGRALASLGEPADPPLATELHHRLAAVAAELGRLAAAEKWGTEALALSEASGSLPDTARSHHQLGVLAAAQERFEEAEARHRKALEIRQDLGDRPGTAASQHQLGVVATRRGDLAGAETWFARALAVREELGDQAGVSVGYHQLGLTAQTGGRAADAEARYRKALDVSHRIGDTPGLVRTFGQFGLFAAEQGRPREAMEWLVRSITCFEEFPHPMTWPSAVNLRLLARDVGPRAVERAWRSVTGRRLPDAVRDHVGG
ncbi:tetratricopeptide repeat protein [Kitasatospora sp. NPDC056327]|uniref:tetratricopeptide repeat protein n=1 Tax=Kitasatospora sp. NPDC056327 TaxID=3345785 RepID=UPI0035DE581B